MIAAIKRPYCSVEGCGKPHEARGWCNAHYRRFRAHGDPLGGGTRNGEPLAFLETVVFSFEGEECLPWPYGSTSEGYGLININGKKRLATRVVCEHEHGPPPTPEHQAAHNCGKGHLGCVNPRHLRWTTRKENYDDRLIHGTVSRGERNGLAKLTEAQVLEIRASQKPQSQLAAEYGVAQSNISQIKSRKNWAWLEDAA